MLIHYFRHLNNWYCIVDDEKTKARKRKLIKSFKSKQRFQMMDIAQKEKADAWKSFVQGKQSDFLFVMTLLMQII